MSLQQNDAYGEEKPQPCQVFTGEQEPVYEEVIQSKEQGGNSEEQSTPLDSMEPYYI